MLSIIYNRKSKDDLDGFCLRGKMRMGYPIG